MRRRKFVINTIAALVNQIVMVICAFILPRMILSTFGSEVNGLVSSIQQFLTIISFMELGLGTVVQASLYKPLADNDNETISKIISSANRFFTRLALCMMVYVVGLLFLYPAIVNNRFSVKYIDSLILSMCISYFAQYFFGLKNQLLVIADQKGYIHYALNTFVLIFNNAVGILLIKNGFSIQFVKLSTSIILMIRPLALEIYVRNNYSINKKIKYEKEPINQKWNGIAQHVATVVLNSTDTIVLTLFSSLNNVSIYNVYYLVINGLNNLVISLTSGFQSLVGNMLSKKEYKLLFDVFDVYESFFHLAVTFIYGCVAILIVPFVLVYTKGVQDINYGVPLFAVLISAANLVYCLRLPYNTIIKSAGHFKETQNSAWIEMLINIIVSVLFVARFGLIGVSVGTLFAMLYRTAYLVIYLSNNIIYRNVSFFVKHFTIDIVCYTIAIFISQHTTLSQMEFGSWLLLAIYKATVFFITCVAINIIVFWHSLVKYRYFLRST